MSRGSPWVTQKALAVSPAWEVWRDKVGGQRPGHRMPQSQHLNLADSTASALSTCLCHHWLA